MMKAEACTANRIEGATLRQAIEKGCEAACSGLDQGTARYAWGRAKMEHIAGLHSRLSESVGTQEATAILAALDSSRDA